MKFNVDQKGYYRVNYPSSDWAAFAEALRDDPSSFTVSDRTSLLGDAFALASAGRLPFATALDLTRYMADKERDLAPWQVVADCLGQLNANLRSTAAADPLKKYMRSLVRQARAELGWEDKGSTERRLMRSQVLQFACQAGDAEALQGAKSMLDDWKAASTSISPNLRSVVYKYGVKEAGQDRTIWDHMLKQYRAEQNAQEKLKLLQGLASTKQEDILRELLELGKDETVVRSQDYFTLLTMITCESCRGR